MGTGKGMYREILLFIAIILVINAGAAVTVESVSVTPDEVWQGEQTTISFSCTISDNNSTNTSTSNATLDTAYMTITDPIQQRIDATGQIPVHGENASISLQYPPPKLGTYNVEVFCGGTVNGSEHTDTAPVTFVSKELVTEQVDVATDPVYTDSEIDLRFNVFEDQGAAQQEITDPGNVDVTFNLPGWTRTNFYYDNRFMLTGTASLTDKSYDAVLDATVDGHTTSTTVPLDVKSPLRATVTDAPDGVVPGGTLSVSLQPWYREEQVAPGNVSIAGATLGGKDVSVDRNGHQITVNVPPAVEDTATLALELAYQGETYTLQRTFDVLYRIRGDLVNVDGKRLSGNIRTVRGTTSQNHQVSNGDYDFKIPGGTYTVHLTHINGVDVIELDGVNVDQSMENVFRVDNPGTLPVTGIDTFGAVGVETVAGFDQATIRLKYDPTRAKSEDNLAVFHCATYNLDSQYCAGTWNPVDADIDTIRNDATVDTSALGGFVIGRRVPLHIDTSINDAYSITDEVAVQGAVKDRNGDPVEDVAVTATLAGETTTTTTGSRGGFSLTVETPENEGEYEFKLDAEKPPYTRDRITQTVAVTADRSLQLHLPNTFTMDAGSEKQYSVTLTNTGEVPLNDINVSATLDCTTCNFSYTPHTVDTLDVVREIDIPVTVAAPQNMGGKTLTGTITTGNDAVSTQETFAVSVQHPLGTTTEGTDTADSTMDDRANATSMVTGFLSALPTPDVTGAVTGATGDVTAMVTNGDALTTLNLFSLVAAVLILGYFKVGDIRSGRGQTVRRSWSIGSRGKGSRNRDLIGRTGGTSRTPDTGHRLNRLKEEARKSVVVVDTETTERDGTADDGVDMEKALDGNDPASFTCSDCDATFTSQRGLSVHETKKH